MLTLFSRHGLFDLNLDAKGDLEVDFHHTVEDTGIVIGDAAGANDPSLGQGLSVCMRDARELRDALLAEPDWDAAIETYADRRATYYAVLREYAKWMAILRIEAGPEADARRALFNRARELDPTQGGFAPIIALGPDGMVADEAARRHLFGEDLGDS